MKTKLLSLLALASCAGSASAAAIAFVGSLENSQVNEWRTSTVAKTMDIDGDNIYGTHGAVQWTRAGINEFGAGSASSGWHYAGETGFGQFTHAGYAQVDDVLDPTAVATWGGGIAAVNLGGTFTFEMTGTAATYAGRTLRVGVMADILTAVEWAADINKTFRLTGPGGGDSGVISLRGGGAGNGQPEMYFFDVTGVNPGDLFVLTTNNTTGGGQAGYAGPMSWDLSPIPEPSTALLAGVAALGLLRRRRA